MKPLARRDGLLIRELGEETVVYDLERHEAHCLNRTAAMVFRLCDGTRSEEEIAEILREQGAERQVREALVRAAVEQLLGARLLVAGREPAFGVKGGEATASRRELLRLSALALPAIVSVVAPTPAQAATCVTESACTESENTCKACELDCATYVCSDFFTGSCVPKTSTGCTP